MSLILGLNTFHGDASACLIRDGELLAAAEEERFRRIKHWAGFPSQAIAYCLAHAQVELGQIDHIAQNSDPRAHWPRKLAYALTRRPSLGLLRDRLRNRQQRASLPALFAEHFPQQIVRAQWHTIEHHYAHLASAFLVSPFKEAVVVSVDGFGDFASAAWGIGQGNTLRLDGHVYFPHSLGMFYQALTQYLGFPNYGDEYKVMGFAPYGQPRYVEPLRQLLQLLSDGTFRLNMKYFRHGRESVPYRWDNGSPAVGTLYTPALEQLLGPARQRDEPLQARHQDMACSIQAVYEEAFFHLLRTLHRRYATDAVALAGGCAMNSVANGKVTLQTPFTQVYVQAAAGDAGGALGAAYAVAQRLGEAARCYVEHAYWGPDADASAIAALLAAQQPALQAAGCHWIQLPEADLLEHTAQALVQGKVVGWFQGRMEWGPRALGARSILADPRRTDMKDILNHKIKRRESFRPFAPAILREAVKDWFDLDLPVPFMSQVFPVRPEKRALIPAVTHVDGSGRLQTVERLTHPRYYDLIQRFGALTGVPILLNTSFNENEPVVCRPEEALDCFLRTRMDALVLGDWLIRRHSSHNVFG